MADKEKLKKDYTRVVQEKEEAEKKADMILKEKDEAKQQVERIHQAIQKIYNKIT
jgi:uncharacterized protein YpuA (DUF1002 family)